MLSLQSMEIILSKAVSQCPLISTFESFALKTNLQSKLYYLLKHYKRSLHILSVCIFVLFIADILHNMPRKFGMVYNITLCLSNVDVDVAPVRQQHILAN